VILTAIINLVFSFVLGKELGLLGILIATAMARLVTNAWYDPYIVFKLGLKKNPIEYLKKYVLYIIVLAIAFLIISFLSNYLSFELPVNFGIKIILCLVVPNLCIFYFLNLLTNCAICNRLFFSYF